MSGAAPVEHSSQSEVCENVCTDCSGGIMFFMERVNKYTCTSTENISAFVVLFVDSSQLLTLIFISTTVWVEIYYRLRKYLQLNLKIGKNIPVTLSIQFNFS